MSPVRDLGEMTRFDQAGNGDAEAEHIKRAERLQSEEDQQSKIDSTHRRATRLRHC